MTRHLMDIQSNCSSQRDVAWFDIRQMDGPYSAARTETRAYVLAEIKAANRQSPIEQPAFRPTLSQKASRLNGAGPVQPGRQSNSGRLLPISIVLQWCRIWLVRKSLPPIESSLSLPGLESTVYDPDREE